MSKKPARISASWKERTSQNELDDHGPPLAIDLVRRRGRATDAAFQEEPRADAVLGMVHRVGEVSGSVWTAGQPREPLDVASMDAEDSGDRSTRDFICDG